MTNIPSKLIERCNNECELCNVNTATIAYVVSPKDDSNIDNMVAICSDCNEQMNNEGNGHYWHFLEGTIWNPVEAVQALSYRIIYNYKEEDWASNLLSGIELDENIKQWALSAFEKQAIHTDAYGNTLENGDTVVLTQALNVKGTNFSAAKGTVVKRIKLVHDNIEQIEGKINDQLIVILTKYVKKSN